MIQVAGLSEPCGPSCIKTALSFLRPGNIEIGRGHCGRGRADSVCTFLAQKLSSLLTSCSSSEWQNGRKYTISLIRPRNSSLRKWAWGGIKEWTMTTSAYQVNHACNSTKASFIHVCFCICATFRIGRITDSLNCREILMSSPFCTSSGGKTWYWH